MTTTMAGAFLLQETTIHEAGTGPESELREHQGQLIVITLGITRIIEQESLEVSIWGSADKTDWGAKPLLAFSQKFYRGTYQMLLDLRSHPEIQSVRVKWAANRWGKGDLKPLFSLYVFAEKVHAQAAERA